MKKFLKSTLILILTLCLIFVFIGCDNSSKKELENLQNQINSLQNQINSTDIDTLQTQLDNLQIQLDAFKKDNEDIDISALQKQIDNIQSLINDLKNNTDDKPTTPTEKIYNIGETIPCIVNGIHMFDIKVTDYYIKEMFNAVSPYKTFRQSVTFEFIPDQILDCSDNIFCSTSLNVNHKLTISDNEIYNIKTISINKDYPTETDILSLKSTYLYLGLTSLNQVDTIFIPFAKIFLNNPSKIERL